METLTHLAINSAVGLGAWKFDFLEASQLVIFVGSYVLDIDHVFEHVIENKSLSIKHFWSTHCNYRNSMVPRFYIFHTVEFSLVLLTVAFYKHSPILNSFVIGWYLHLVCDIAKYVWYYKNDFSWFNYWLLYKWKNLK